VAGGAGFIGSNLLNYLVPKYPQTLFINIDKLTYAGNLTNLKEVEGCENYRFVKGDICDAETVGGLFETYQPSGIINLAAQSHVDRSILNPGDFFETNIRGVFVLLETVRKFRKDKKAVRFHQVSTDEVYGSLPQTEISSEKTPYNPSSPYAASKASADHLARTYAKTYNLDIVISISSNNYGPYQFPEKLIPLTIHHALYGEEIPVYGDGSQERDWVYVLDHCRALDLVYHKGRAGATYCIGSGKTISNLGVIKLICRLIDRRLGREGSEKLIKFIQDRPGHDQRYATDSSLIRAELGWSPEYDLHGGLETTIDWYLEKRDWLQDCLSGEYKKFQAEWYGNLRKSGENGKDQ